MSRTTNHFALVSALALALAPAAAQARFGKSDEHRSDNNTQQSSNNNSGGSNNGNAVTSSNEGHYHSASPVGSDRPVVVQSSDCAVDGCCWRHGYGWPAYFYEPGYAYVGYSGEQVQASPSDYGVRIRTELTADVMPFRTLDGASAAAQLRVEGVKWGVALEGRHIAVAATDGSGATDHLSFFNGFVSYALLGNEHGRLRLEAGANTAFAPDLIVMSPAVGASVALGFGSNLGLEAVARASVYPHVQVEVGAGLSYALGPLGLRLGVREIYLNDNGWVDGVAHEDSFTGPYLGVGMAF